jgi:hypothetical protein
VHTAILLTSCAVLIALQAPAADPRAADLEVFEQRFLAVDRSYDAGERARAMEKFAALKRETSRMSAARFELAVAEIVAMANNGHTNVGAAQWPRRFNRIVPYFLLFDDGLRIAASDDDVTLNGALVTAIAGKTLDELRAVWARYQPGVPRWRDQQMHHFLESPELLHAAGIAPDADGVEISVTRADGTRETRRFAGRRDEAGPRFRNPRELEIVPAGAPAARPLYLQEPAKAMRYVEIADRDTVYIQFRRNFDPMDPNFRQSADALAGRLKERRPRHVIVDQRFNGGGDLNNTRDLMKAIPGAIRDGGRIFVITSARTFSAGISSVGYLKQAGGAAVTIVGQPVGDVLDFWAEGTGLTLPNSGIRIGFATERHNYQTGCPEPECHGAIRRNPIAVRSLAPDLSPKFTWAEFRAGRDPYLDAILALLKP